MQRLIERLIERGQPLSLSGEDACRTPMDYLRDVRLRRAAQLLQVGGSSVDGVAGKVGYASRRHFSQAFSEQFGCSPTEFRNQYH